jgi:hypothetical protein
MNASATRQDAEDTGHDTPTGPPAPDPGMVESSHETFSGFVRTSTFAAIGIALLLIAMALFLL